MELNNIYIEHSYHYVYRITNMIEKKHYYGVRSCKIDPSLDLGIKYFSSSKDLTFIKEQKINPHKFKYKIIRRFRTRKLATDFEIFLHAKFDVGKNPNFYNKAAQVSEGFCTAGKIVTKDDQGNTKLLSVNDERIQTGELKTINSGMTTVKDSSGNIFSVTVDDPRYISGELVGITKGNRLSDAHRLKISAANSRRKHSDETKDKISNSNKGKIISDEQRSKLSRSLTGRMLSKEHRAKISEANRRRKLNKKNSFT